MNLEVYKNNSLELSKKLEADFTKKVATYHDVYNQSPSLRQIVNIDKTVVVKTIFPFIVKYFPKFNAMQLELLLDDIRNTCMNWNALDFKLCYSNGLKGKYGTVYGDLKVSDVIGWMDKYQLDERFDIRQQLKHNKRFEPLTNPNAVDNPMSREERSRQLQKHKAIGLTKKGLSDGTYSKNTVDVTGVNAEIKRHSEDGNEEHEQIKGGANIYLHNLMKEIDEKSKK